MKNIFLIVLLFLFTSTLINRRVSQKRVFHICFPKNKLVVSRRIVHEYKLRFFFSEQKSIYCHFEEINEDNFILFELLIKKKQIQSNN